MNPITPHALRTLAAARGLELTDAELARILPLVQAGRDVMTSIRDALPSDAEPGTLYRMS